MKARLKVPINKKRFQTRQPSTAGTVRQAFSNLETAKEKVRIQTKVPFSFSPRHILTRAQAYFELIKLYSKLFIARGSTVRSVLMWFSRGISTLLICSVLYLCFFDSFFVTQKIEVTFSPNSYLEPVAIDKLISAVREDRTIGFLPTASYWFATSEQLTNLGLKINSDITKISITNRSWPSTLALQITTTPVLATISYKQNSYIISQSGDVLGLDAISLATNTIKINTVSKPSEFLTNQLLNKNDKSLLNKIYFALKVNEILSDTGVSVSSTTISSDLPEDQDITVVANKTILYFSVKGLSQSDLEIRIQNLFTQTALLSKIQNESLSYIDMRFPRNVFVCPKDVECSRTL